MCEVMRGWLRSARLLWIAAILPGWFLALQAAPAGAIQDVIEARASAAEDASEPRKVVLDRKSVV